MSNESAKEPPKQMNLQELFAILGLENKEIIAHLINPIRKGEPYTKGRITGFKSGLWGGGHHNYKRDKREDGLKVKSAPRAFSGDRLRWIKKPKVHITYNIFEFGGREHSDWVDVDNCTFEIQTNE